jgi:hypothetical protein
MFNKISIALTSLIVSMFLFIPISSAFASEYTDLPSLPVPSQTNLDNYLIYESNGVVKLTFFSTDSLYTNDSYLVETKDPSNYFERYVLTDGSWVRDISYQSGEFAYSHAISLWYTSLDIFDQTTSEVAITGNKDLTQVDPEPTPGDNEEDNNNMEPETGGINMFDSLTSTAITTEATTWAGNFDALLLVVVGVGIGFACVRFVKSLFF